MTPREALEKLQRVLAAEPDDVPEGWLTAEQWAAETGKSAQSVRRSMQLGKSRGLVETQNFRIEVGSVVRPVPHYRIVQ